MVEKLNWKYCNLLQWFELGYVNMLTLSYVKENTIHEEQKSLNIKMLAPT